MCGNKQNLAVTMCRSVLAGWDSIPSESEILLDQAREADLVTSELMHRIAYVLHKAPTVKVKEVSASLSSAYNVDVHTC